MTYMDMALQKNPDPYNIYNWLDPSMVIITIFIAFLNHARNRDENVLKIYITFTHFLPNLSLFLTTLYACEANRLSNCATTAAKNIENNYFSK